MYAVGVTNVPAFVGMAPVKVARPPVAIGDPAAGVKSNAEMLAGAAPTAGIAVNSDAAVAVLSVRLLAVAIERELRRRRRLEEQVVRLGEEDVPDLEIGRRRRRRVVARARLYVSASRSETPSAVQRATTPLT